MAEGWSNRRIRILGVMASVLLSVLAVIVSEYLLHRSIRTEMVIRAFVISAGISVVMTKVYAGFVNRLRQTEAALRNSEAKNRAILQALPDLMFQFSLDGRFLDYHAARGANLWYPPEAFLGKSVYEVFPHPFADQAIDYIQKAASTRQIQCYEYQNPEDAQQYYEARIVMLQEESVLVIIRDITAQKTTEVALQNERAMLTQRVAERTAELHNSNTQLLNALQARDEFLANINHELRTPLTPILVFSDLLHNEHYGPLNERQKQVSANIKESAQHLLELLSDILDFSDIKSGELKLEIELVNVNDICWSSLRQIEPAARNKRIHMSMALDNAVTTVRADAQRLKQILNNLLKNAIKFTPNGGTVGLEVHGDLATRTACFSVWDTGIGIDVEQLPQIFQPFNQIQPSLTREQEGAGIGLALVRYLVELHNGSVTVESQVGQGSRFTVSMPWIPIPAHAGTMNTDILSKVETTTPSINSIPMILVVEDNAMNRKVLCHMLNMAGYATLVASDGAAAIDALRTHRPDLVLMDIRMPGMDGLEATRRIRADAELSATPIIAVTALTMPGDRERCLAAGVNHYLSKPMDMQELLKIIADILAPQSTESASTKQISPPAPTPPAPD